MIPLMIYGFGSEKRGKLNRESEIRCIEADKVFSNPEIYGYWWDKIIITGRRERRATKSLAQLMKEFLIELGVEEDKIIAKGVAQNTEAETEVAFLLLGEDKPAFVGTVNAWYQKWRIRRLWRKKGVEAICFSCSCPFGLSNLLSLFAEPLKIILLSLGLKRAKVVGAV